MKKNSLLLSACAALLPLFAASSASATVVSITAIYGSGNPNADWDAFVSGNTQIGLRAKTTATGATPDNGAGLYSFAAGEVWNFEASFNSNFSGTAGTHLNAYAYSWTLSGPGIAGGSQTFSPTVYGDNSYGTAATGNGLGVEGAFAALSATNDIMQLSQKITFFPFSGSFSNEGLYTLSASILELQSGRTVNSGSIQIQVGTGVPDGGVTGLMLAFAFAGFVVFQRRIANA